jgi:hypothetical protein
MALSTGLMRLVITMSAEAKSWESTPMVFWSAGKRIKINIETRVVNAREKAGGGLDISNLY